MSLKGVDMSLLTDIFRRLAILGVTLFFAALVFLLVTHVSRNPMIINGVLSGIGDIINDCFSLVRGV